MQLRRRNVSKWGSISWNSGPWTWVWNDAIYMTMSPWIISAEHTLSHRLQNTTPRCRGPQGGCKGGVKAVLISATGTLAYPWSPVRGSVTWQPWPAQLAAVAVWKTSQFPAITGYWRVPRASGQVEDRTGENQGCAGPLRACHWRKGWQVLPQWVWRGPFSYALLAHLAFRSRCHFFCDFSQGKWKTLYFQLQNDRLFFSRAVSGLIFLWNLLISHLWFLNEN